jgi:hypothetical protein
LQQPSQTANRPYCAFPWFHGRIETDGQLKPCCKWPDSVPECDIDGYIHTDYMENLRQQFKQGQGHRYCKTCEFNEQVKGYSHRTWSFELADLIGVDFSAEPTLMSQDVNLNNICNIKCRSCNQTSSTSWLSDAISLGQLSVGLRESGWYLSAETAKNTERLQFLGGEPMMHQTRIIEALIQVANHGNISRLQLHMSSNMTHDLNEEMQSYFSVLREVKIDCSIDAFGQLNDYIRSDSTWDRVSAVTKNLRDICAENARVKAKITSVFSVYNAHAMLDLLDWVDSKLNPHIRKLSVILCKHPPMLDARNLPTVYKQALIDSYTRRSADYPRHQSVISAITNHLSMPATIPLPVWLSMFSEYNDRLDSLRRTSLKMINPELSACLEGYSNV